MLLTPSNIKILSASFSNKISSKTVRLMDEWTLLKVWRQHQRRLLVSDRTSGVVLSRNMFPGCSSAALFELLIKMMFKSLWTLNLFTYYHGLSVWPKKVQLHTVMSHSSDGRLQPGIKDCFDNYYVIINCHLFFLDASPEWAINNGNKASAPRARATNGR